MFIEESIMSVKGILHTRPFQPLFRAADDLLKLAFPYFKRIEKRKREYEKTQEISIPSSVVWQMEKSLCIASFMAKYAGLEALVNCIHSDFKIRNLVDLPEDYFIGPIRKQKSKMTKKTFTMWHLASRVFMIIPICSSPITDPRTIIDIDCKEWSKFLEIIDIRHSFIHAEEAKIQYEITKSDNPKISIVDDKALVNYCP
jgi:hypothetical protein